MQFHSKQWFLINGAAHTTYNTEELQNLKGGRKIAAILKSKVVL